MWGSRRFPAVTDGQGRGEKAHFYRGEQKANMIRSLPMDEGRKKIITIVAGMLLCRRLPVLLAKNSPAREMAFRESIDLAEELVRRVDKRWPSVPGKT